MLFHIVQKETDNMFMIEVKECSMKMLCVTMHPGSNTMLVKRTGNVIKTLFAHSMDKHKHLSTNCLAAVEMGRVQFLPFTRFISIFA